jgi:hypothetical protein
MKVALTIPKRGKTSYKRNSNYFQKLTLENCYWAGFIAADGNIQSKSNRSARLSIQLHKKDIQHLIKFKNSIQYDGPIGLINTRPHVYINIRDNQICYQLNKNFNITPNKSLTLKPPKLNGKFALAFIKGYIDGDGHISKAERKILKIVSGSKILLLWIKNQLDNIIVCKANILPKVNIWQYQIEGYNVDIILKYLKQIITPELDRKWSNI